MEQLQVTSSKLTKSLLEKLNSFYATFYDKNNRIFNENYLPWLLNNNPVGNGKVITITLDNELISSMLIVPIEVKSTIDIKKGYFVTDVLSHPNHRDKNLFVRMIRFLVTRVKEENSFIIGHPNKNAIPGWKRTKMEFQSPLQSLLYIGNLRSIFKIKKIKLKTLSQLEEINNYLCSPESNLIINADAKYLYWRYLQHPTNNYDVVAHYIDNNFVGITVEVKTKKLIKKVIHSDVITDYQQLVYTSSLAKMFILPQNFSTKTGHRLSNKDITYFFTSYNELDEDIEHISLTLASSDV
ncbi:GNAT family N-acetyltransferase [Providencia alcalifaciens]